MVNYSKPTKSMYSRIKGRIRNISNKRNIKKASSNNRYLLQRDAMEHELATQTQKYSPYELQTDPYARRSHNITLAYAQSLKNNIDAYSQHKITLGQLKSLDNKARSAYEKSLKESKSKTISQADLERKINKMEQKSSELKGKIGSKKHQILEEIAAVVLIVIGASIILSTDATITTYSVIPEYEDQGKFFIVGILLIALGIFFPSLAFIKNLIKKSKNKNSRVNKKKKKSKK